MLTQKESEALDLFWKSRSLNDKILDIIFRVTKEGLALKFEYDIIKNQK